MNQISEFFRGIFSTDSWPARWYCGYWSEFHGWLYIISDLMIWTSYFLIPLIIIKYFTRKKNNIRFQRGYLLFAAFILLCGATHFFDAMMFWIPMYRLNALLRLVTGVVSLATVYYLVKMLPDLIGQKTNTELEAEILLRKHTEVKLEEANEGLKTFASLASHDLQEPLRKIGIYSSMLDERYGQQMDAAGKEMMAKVNRSVERMQVMIKDVLTLSTMDKDIEFRPVDLNHVVRIAMDNLELKIREKQATINVATLPQIMGDEGFMVQLFYNLISNGLKFNARQPLINISAETTSDYITINVSDNGIGISEEHHTVIFESLQRLHGKNAYEGTGLGLTLCKKIADVHKATIDISSEKDVGSTFSVRFPRVAMRG